LGVEKNLNDLKLVIVTPVKNEAERIARLSSSLSRLEIEFPFLWIVVNDSSSDNILEVLANDLSFKPNFVLDANTSGRIALGGAYQAWQVGVKFSIKEIPDFTHLMKLDADVELEPNYLSLLENSMSDKLVGIVGGVLSNDHREQVIHVPGPVKMYSKQCLLDLADLPLATGYDVMDEVLASKLGYGIHVIREALFKINRPIGASQGLLHGRRRNGMVCRWTGYYGPYFLLHLLRFSIRKPFVFGSIAMLIGYATAPESPYSTDLQFLHKSHQKSLILGLLRNPLTKLRFLYARPSK
jgi:dolichol-phosphate mannosyltransferase